MDKKFIKNIIFTKQPLIGCYRYKEEFQVYPLDIPSAPKSEYVENKPCCFEFYYRDEDVKYFTPFNNKNFDKIVSETTAQSNKRNRILNLLTTVTNYRFHFKGGMDIIWVVPLSDQQIRDRSNDINDLVSQPGAELYYYKDISKDLLISNLSPFDTENILFLPTAEYYTRNYKEQGNNFIKLPNIIDQFFDNYYMLNQQKQLIIDSASYQLCCAIDLMQTNKSLSFFSAVSSIETMVSLEFRNEIIEFECNECQTLKSSNRVCSKCGRPKWGIAEKFREYLKKYVSAHPESVRKYNKIYSVRSKIAHTEFLLYNENILDWSMKDKSRDMLELHLNAIQLARLSVVKWVLGN